MQHPRGYEPTAEEARDWHAAALSLLQGRPLDDVDDATKSLYFAIDQVGPDDAAELLSGTTIYSEVVTEVQSSAGGMVKVSDLSPAEQQLYADYNAHNAETAAGVQRLLQQVAAGGPGSIPSKGIQLGDASATPDPIIIGAVDAVAQSGGDPSQPTAVVDRASGTTVAVVRQLSSGDISVSPVTSHRDLARVVNTVVGAIDQAAGTITNIGTQIKKVGNAIQGGAAGAQAGYNAPTDLKPFVIGGALLAGVIVLPKLLSGHGGRRS